jgi:hypothetical protein
VKYENARQVLESLKSEVNTIPVPSKPSAQNFFAEYKKLLHAGQEELELVGKLIQVMEDPKLDDFQKFNQAQIIHTDAKTKEENSKEAVQRLQSSQHIFAKEYNIKLINIPGVSP